MVRWALAIVFGLFAAVSHAEVLTHLSNIYRAPIAEDEKSSFFGLNKFYQIRQPTAADGYGHYIYIADSFKNIIYRYNTMLESLTPLYATEEHLKGPVSALYVDSDLSIYVADPYGKQVLHFSSTGKLLQRYSDPANLTNPVSLLFDQSSGQLFVADGFYNHVVVFNSLGTAITAIGNRGSEREALMQLIDIAAGAEGIYLLDRMNKSFYTFSTSGYFRLSHPRHEVNNPTAIAVDHYGRVYISDAFDDTIKVYRHDSLIDTVGGTGSGDALFRGISDLSVDPQFLYVADTGNDRIQVFVLNPPASGGSKK